MRLAGTARTRRHRIGRDARAGSESNRVLLTRHIRHVPMARRAATDARTRGKPEDAHRQLQCMRDRLREQSADGEAIMALSLTENVFLRSSNRALAARDSAVGGVSVNRRT